MKRTIGLGFLLGFLSIGGGSAQVPSPVRTESLDAPSKHAWDIFVEISWPALDPVKTRKRGVPAARSGSSRRISAARRCAAWRGS